MSPMSLSTPLSGAARPSSSPFNAFWQREPRLVAFALLILATMLPAAIGLGLDDRVLRGVSVWVKPMKFMASVALLALTTAWFAPLLPDAVRRSRGFSWLVWTVIATGGFEVLYITLQAALGQPSHYNVGDPFHAAMYSLMGLGALLLTATQPWLAWLIWRHGERRIAPAYRQAILLGLVLTFVLGASVGIMLGGGQPATGAGLPVLGWSRTMGDLRVAHFFGIHAGQVLPLVGFVLARAWPRAAVPGVWSAAVLWSALWAAALLQALAGQPLLSL